MKCVCELQEPLHGIKTNRLLSHLSKLVQWFSGSIYTYRCLAYYAFSLIRDIASLCLTKDVEQKLLTALVFEFLVLRHTGGGTLNSD